MACLESIEKGVARKLKKGQKKESERAFNLYALKHTTNAHNKYYMRTSTRIHILSSLEHERVAKHTNDGAGYSLHPQG